jgi:hypothetical protein
MNEHVRRDHEDLLESLVGGKLPRNLSWNAVVNLIGQIGEVQPRGNDEFAFVVGSQKGFFKRPSTHDLGVEEISRLRKFLKEAGIVQKSAEPHVIDRMVVVIDHHAAHIYHDLGGRLPKDEVAVTPYDPFGFHHHLVHRKEAHYKSELVPEEGFYYEEIAADLVHAEAIVIIGHGTGKSSASGYVMLKMAAPARSNHSPKWTWAGMAAATYELSEPDGIARAEAIKRQPGNNVLMDLAPAVRVGISLLPGS